MSLLFDANAPRLSALSVDADRITIGDLAREAGVTLRALRFYQSKGLLAPQRNGNSRVFSNVDRTRLALIQQGKRLGFTLGEIRDMLAARARLRQDAADQPQEMRGTDQASGSSAPRHRPGAG